MRIFVQLTCNILGLFAGLLCFWLPHAAEAQNRFYLTVEKSFAPTQNPEVRLDYTNARAPLVLRILKPKDIEKFLDGQLNISRSYEEPLTELNPGHYLIRGINQVNSPLPLLRSALSEEFRLAFKGNAFTGSLKESADPTLLTPPREISAGPPAGFETVREIYIDLQKGGEIPKGLYGDWGFESEGRFQVRTLTLDPLPDGLYLLQGVQEKTEAQALLQVSALSVQVKQSTSQLVVRVQDRTGQPTQGAKVSYRDSRGKWIALPAPTSASGELVYENTTDSLDGKLVIRVSDRFGQNAFTDTDFLPSSVLENSVFIVTDRPIFKPGETFYFKGLVRRQENGALRIPQIKNPEATVHLYRTDGTDVGSSQKIAVTEFGSFSGELTLAETQPPGLYRVVTEVDGKGYAGELRVSDYVKPTYYLELVSHDETIHPGENFQFRIHAKRYAGGSPQGVRFETYLYRKKFEAPTFVLEAGAGLEAGHDYFGKVRSVAALTQPQRLFSSVEARVASLGDQADFQNPWGSAPQLDADGYASAEIVVPKSSDHDLQQDWIYTLVIRAMDSQGAFASLSENITVSQSDAVPAAQFASPLLSKQESQVTLFVRSSLPNDTPVGNANGYVEVSLEDSDGRKEQLPKVNFTTAEDGIAKVQFPRPTKLGRLTALTHLTSIGDKKFARISHAEPTSLILAGEQGEAVIASNQLELYTAHTILSPGEKTQILAVLPRDRASQGSQKAWQTIAGTRIFSTQVSELQGQSHWFEVEAKPEYGTGFYQSLTIPMGNGKFAERSVGFRVIPSDKRLAVKVIPSADSTAPLSPFRLDVEVQDAFGAPAPEVELSINVVDKAVYAVQPEFRPAILDFFYPLPRLNLATFYSDDLQGYGYGDEIRKPTFRLAALKSRTQPVKRNMRDTAGWFPHVLTDSQGKASVTIAMPANLTEWIVTAVGADKNGRVGEGKGGFRSSSDLGLELRLPQFLRDGDTVHGAIEANNTSQQKISVDLSPKVSGSARLSDENSQSLSPEPGSSQTLPITVSGNAEGRSSLIQVGLKASGNAQVGGAREFELAVLPAKLNQTVYARGYASDLPKENKSYSISVALPEQSVASEGKVRIISGLLGAALVAAKELVSYPYGCTEQLSHSTMPNLMLLDLVERTKLTEDKLAALGLSESVSLAKTNAEKGVRKILGNQKPDGGFSLWPSGPNSDLGVTLIALRTLNLATERQVPGADGGLSRGRRWVSEALKAQSLPLGNSLGRYYLGLLAELNFSEFDQQYIEFIQSTLDTPAPFGFNETLAAMRILNSRSTQYWFMDKLARPQAIDEMKTRLTGLLQTVDFEMSVQSVSNDFTPLGFRYGEPAILAQLLGALDEAKILSNEMRQTYTKKIMQHFTGGWWYSTFDTAEVMYGLRPLLSDEMADFEAHGIESHAVSFQVAGKPESFSFGAFPGGYEGGFSARAISGSTAKLNFQGLKPTDYVSVALESEVPFAAVKPAHDGLAVQRILNRITASGSEPISEGTTLHAGDTVVSTIELIRSPTGPSRRAASSFVVVEDGLPALAQGIEDDRTYLADAKIAPSDDSYWSKVKETLRYPDRTVRVVEVLPGASFRSSQVWRVAYAGHAVIPPVRAFDMYNSEISGNSLPFKLQAE